METLVLHYVVEKLTVHAVLHYQVELSLSLDYLQKLRMEEILVQDLLKRIFAYLIELDNVRMSDFLEYFDLP